MTGRIRFLVHWSRFRRASLNLSSFYMTALFLLINLKIIDSLITQSPSSENTNFNYNSIKRSTNESLVQQPTLDCNKLFQLWLRLEHFFPLLTKHLRSEEMVALNKVELILSALTNQKSALLSQKSPFIDSLETNPTYSRIIHQSLQAQAKQSNQEHHQQQITQFQVAPELEQVEKPHYIYGSLISHPNSRQFDSIDLGNKRTLDKLRKLRNEYVTQANKLDVGVWRSTDQKNLPNFSLTGEF